MYLSPMPGGKMILDVGFLDETHGSSSRTVACLQDARLELNLECRRREGEKDSYSEHTLSWVRVLGRRRSRRSWRKGRPASFWIRPACPHWTDRASSLCNFGQSQARQLVTVNGLQRRDADSRKRPDENGIN